MMPACHRMKPTGYSNTTQTLTAVLQYCSNTAYTDGLVSCMCLRHKLWNVDDESVVWTQEPNQIVSSRHTHRLQQVDTVGQTGQLDTKSRKYEGLGRAGQVCCCDLESGGGFTLCDTLPLHY